MSMEGISNRGVGQVSQQPGTHEVQGKLGDHQVEIGRAQPRAGNAIKTFFLEVKHFFASLFGIRVSTPKPERIDSVHDGVKAVVSDFTHKNLDRLELMKSLGKLHDVANFHTPENRDPTSNTPKTDGLFRDHLGTLSDLQLLRLHSNLSKHEEFLRPLVLCGTNVIMGHVDSPSRENMFGVGKVNDLGWLGIALSEDVVAELKARGYEVPDINIEADKQVTPEMEAVAYRTIMNGGDVGKAVDELRREIVNARLEQSGLPTLDQVSGSV